jgi:hypothetical protein
LLNLNTVMDMEFMAASRFESSNIIESQDVFVGATGKLCLFCAWPLNEVKHRNMNIAKDNLSIVLNPITLVFNLITFYPYEDWIEEERFIILFIKNS